MYIVINDELERYVDANYPGLKPNTYKVSNYGNVINIKTGRIKTINSRTKDGYVRGIFKGINNKNIYISIHRLVAWNFCDGYDEKSGRICVNHIDSIRDHNYYKNLEWVTVQENNKHSFTHGYAKPNITHLVGELNGMCRYGDDFTHSICKLFVVGLDVKSVMQELGYERCSDNTRLYDFLRYVKRRKYRKSISDQYDF